MKMSKTTVWEVDARVMEAGDAFKVADGWAVVSRTRQIPSIIYPGRTMTELLFQRADATFDYIWLYAGRKVVVPVLPKSL